MLAMMMLVPWCVCFPIAGGLELLGLIFWIMMIIEIVQKEPSEGNDKIIWLLIVILLHWLGALIYFLVRRPERIRKYGS
ncbi:MAG: PLDc N-terminal domain-containing protein [Phycisphaerae bacterium]